MSGSLKDNARTFPDMLGENIQCCRVCPSGCCDCSEQCAKEEWVRLEVAEKQYNDLSALWQKCYEEWKKTAEADKQQALTQLKQKIREIWKLSVVLKGRLYLAVPKREFEALLGEGKVE